MVNIGLFLMSEKGYQVLIGLCEAGNKMFIKGVCIGKDKAVDNDFSVEIEKFCKEEAIPFFYMSNIPESYECDYYFAISWRWMLPPDRLIVLHDSLLPKYRGFAPLVNALKNGEPQIGVTALWASNEYDRGLIIKQIAIAVEYPIKIKDAIAKIIPLYVQLVNEICQFLVDNIALPGRSQNEIEASYSLWLDEKDYFIEWNNDAAAISRFVDATGWPYDGAKTYVGGKLVKILHCEPVADVTIENRIAGKVVFIENGLPIVVCGTGLLKIKEAIWVEPNISIIPFKKMRTKFTYEYSI